MNIEEKHAETVKRLLKASDEIRDELNSEAVNLAHLALGISGECGEIVDAIKKRVIYNQPLNISGEGGLLEELGDLEFYLQGLRVAARITREETLAANIAKLEKRYGAGYTDKAAKVRADKS